MTKTPRLPHLAIFAILAAVVAAVALVGGPASSASAAPLTATYLSMHPTVASPIAGQQVTMQIYTGSLDGSYPAGEVNVSVEGTGMIVGGPVNTVNGGFQVTIGNFPIGTITVDASFTPANGAIYSPISTKASVTIVGADDSLSPVFPTAPTLGHPVTVSTILVIAAGDSRAPGGVVGFDVGGVSVGVCTPAATGAARNWSCSATLPAPTKAGPYTVTASFGRSGYYLPATGSVTATVAAAAVPAPVKRAAVAAPAPVAVATPATPTATATPTVAPSSTPSAEPFASGAKTADARTPAASTIDSWAVLFLVLLALLLAAGVATLVVLKRRRMRAASPPKA